jgi:hypothetical protein
MTDRGRPRTVSDEAIIAAILACGGSIRAAAERCGVTTRAIHARLASDPCLYYHARRVGWVPVRSVRRAA